MEEHGIANAAFGSVVLEFRAQGELAWSGSRNRKGVDVAAESAVDGAVLDLVQHIRSC